MNIFKSIAAVLFGVMVSIGAQAEVPVFKTGDLIFQTSRSEQSRVIQIATESPFSHVGVVEVSASGKIYVVEAIRKVSRTRLDVWIARGVDRKFAVFRLSGLAPAKSLKFVAAAKTYIGRPYDIYFSGLNKSIYCSELVDYAARDVGLKVGRYQKFGTLNVNESEVIELARKRWEGHPRCKRLSSFEQCWPQILDDEMVTPVSLTEDQRLEKVYSNF